MLRIAKFGNIYFEEYDLYSNTWSLLITMLSMLLWSLLNTILTMLQWQRLHKVRLFNTVFLTCLANQYHSRLISQARKL